MTRDDIIRMAEEAGVWPKPYDSIPTSAEFREHVIKFAKLVAAHEREQISQFVERLAPNYDWEAPLGKRVALDLAMRIRART